jgi:hypothetical protein
MRFSENDVKAIALPGGAVEDLSLRTLIERRRLSILVALTFFVYLEPLTSYSTLFIWLGLKHPRIFGDSLSLLMCIA